MIIIDNTINKESVVATGLITSPEIALWDVLVVLVGINIVVDIETPIFGLLIDRTSNSTFENAIFSVDNAIFSVENAISSVDNAILSVENGMFSVENGMFSVDNGMFSVNNAIFSVSFIIDIEDCKQLDNLDDDWVAVVSFIPTIVAGSKCSKRFKIGIWRY